MKEILNALLVCKHFSMGQLMIENHSSLAIEWICSKENRPWKLSNELNLIDALILEVGCIGISHIFREGNSMEDFLTKLGHGSPNSYD